MKKYGVFVKLLPINIVVLILFIFTAFYGSQAVTVINQNSPIINTQTVVIDAGHGDPDGGATSCTGVLESDINLEIAIRLNDLCRFLGINTTMIRQTRESVYTSGNSISSKKISDLKNRVELINHTDGAVLISIHQNHFYDSQYSGAQVFYGNHSESKQLAQSIQGEFVRCLNPGSRRKAKLSSGVYLMEHINCTGVLVECGFLSNPEEDAKLQNSDYQIRICSVIATSVNRYLNENTHLDPKTQG